MPTESPRPLARQLLRLALGAPDVPDRDLLSRFVAARDDDAFAEIVRRHGPLVLAVCRRVTGHAHDAEDAFQAAFLVLARRAGHVGRPEALANWLYGVACRTALEARALRRRSPEPLVPTAPEPAAPPAPDDLTDLRQVIDEELVRLPDKYRTAVVLCDLEGLPRATAAARMGIPEGTLSSRLAHARKVLAERLTRRGVTATATVLGAALERDALAAALPHTLMNVTVSLAVRSAPGGVVPFGIAPAVSHLTDGVLKTMLVTRLRQLFAVGLLTCGLIGVGLACAQQFGAPEGPPPVDPLAAQRGTVQADEPASAQPNLPQKPPEPKKYAAKGVEDEDVPYPSFPSQAVVRIEDGKLVVRMRTMYYEPVSFKAANGQIQSIYQQKKGGVNAALYDTDDVAVFDMKGNRLAPKAWKELFKSDVHALIAHDGKLPNPREMTLFKSDTLLVVLPAPTGMEVPPRAVPAPPTAAPVPTPATPYPQQVPPGPSRFEPGPPAPTGPVPSYVPGPARNPLPPTPTESAPPQISPRENSDPNVEPGAVLGNVRGSVTREMVDNLVRISIGQDAGLKLGSKLMLYRETGGPVPGTVYIGKLVVVALARQDAACEFKPARPVKLDELQPDERPRKGDTVAVYSTEKIPVENELPQAVPGTVLRGTVMSDFANDRAHILISTEALKPGSKLDVYRDTDHLGTLVVTKILDSKEALCEFRTSRGVALEKLRPEELPRKGDTVSMSLVKP